MRRWVLAVGVIVALIVIGAMAYATTLKRQVITFTSYPYQAPIGATYAVTATGGGSGNPVVITVSPKRCTISNGVVTFTHLGVCTITAEQAGSTNWKPAPAVTQKVLVVR